MMKGDAYSIPISIETSDGAATPESFEDIEVCIGRSVRKTFSSGEITYDAERAQFTAGSSKAEALAETARRLCDIVTESIPGEGRLYLAEFTRSGQETVCRFEYLVSGIGVAMSRPAATITFDGLSVRSAIFCVRSFTGSGKS